MAIKHTSRYQPRDNSYKNTLGRNPLLQEVTKMRNGEPGQPRFRREGWKRTLGTRLGAGNEHREREI